LSEAIEGALKIYAHDRRHPLPLDLAAQHLGYKSANSGAAVKALASIRYFGLLGRPQDGRLAVEKDVEDYHFSPDSQHREQLIRRWLLTPPVFAEVLGQFTDCLPSDATLKFHLIQRGFLPEAADALVEVLKQSVEFAQYYNTAASEENASLELISPHSSGTDRIPVRLSGGRRAYLEIPVPFLAADKERLKSQIDLILVDDDESP
jgi:hypothetical protein